MSLVVVFVSDRGDRYLPHCRASFRENMPVGIAHTEIVIDDFDHKLGMAGAVRAGFEAVLAERVDYALWIEEDFVFTAPIPVRQMQAILVCTPRLAQVVLKRQPWSPEEVAAGGIIETQPDLYEQQTIGDGRDFVEHRRIFSLNPCLIPRRVLSMGWPDGNEAGFTAQCLEAGYSFAFYGSIEDPPLVQHVGVERGSGWRL